jgi:adenylate cyclase class 2
MRHEEIEVKFVIADLPALRQRLLTLGATLATPRTYEENVLFDTPDGQLTRQGRVLRVRRDRRNTITYKEPPIQPDPDFKVLDEYEVQVSDVAPAHAILVKLGFRPTLRYEKYRETFTYQGAEIVLDEVPFGVFMEIEAPRDVIRSLAAALGLDFEARLVASYSEIFAAVCATYNLAITDMTFEAFRSLAIDVRTCQLH